MDDAARLVQQRAVGAEAEALSGGSRVDFALGELALQSGGGARHRDGVLAGGIIVGLVRRARGGFRGLDG